MKRHSKRPQSSSPYLPRFLEQAPSRASKHSFVQNSGLRTREASVSKASEEAFKVFVRVRPLNPREAQGTSKARGNGSVIKVHDSTTVRHS
jgi:hypothetical protein